MGKRKWREGLQLFEKPMQEESLLMFQERYKMRCLLQLQQKPMLKS